MRRLFLIPLFVVASCGDSDDRFTNTNYSTNTVEQVDCGQNPDHEACPREVSEQ